MVKQGCRLANPERTPGRKFNRHWAHVLESVMPYRAILPYRAVFLHPFLNVLNNAAAYIAVKPKHSSPVF